MISGTRQPLGTQHRRSAALTTFKALYPFTARNDEELSFETDDLIEVSFTVDVKKPDKVIFKNTKETKYIYYYIIRFIIEYFWCNIVPSILLYIVYIHLIISV